MEDAPDFSWDSAKACHAVVLTNMEADRLNWTDTDKIDHIFRTKAYKHKGILCEHKPLPHVCRLKRTKTLNQKMVSFADTFRKYPTHHRTAG